MPWWAVETISFHSSGSSFSAREVEPTMSVNKIVTGLRSPSTCAEELRIFSLRSEGAACWSAARRSFSPAEGCCKGTGVPHFLQKLAPGFSGLLQRVQTRAKQTPDFSRHLT